MFCQPSVNRLQAYIEAAEFKGYDPYDALNSSLLSGLSFCSKYLRIAFIQFLKRNPINLRPLLLLKKRHNPKGLGLFLWGYTKLYAREKDSRYLEKIERILEWFYRLVTNPKRIRRQLVLPLFALLVLKEKFLR